ncbi:threonylcarbamoyl-AMP synthase [Desulfovibrio sp. OttesenSCG-928-A18]|nr:threonylcarbamoyl-AMP synthase [Desulfovibrio sp. OttesenSCG-928-A18]
MPDAGHTAERCSASSLSLEMARDALLRGSMLIFPTETFYALGCDAMNPDAVGRVFSLKKRPLTLPLPVVIGAMEQLERLVSHVTPVARELMRLFWPGPLSLVLPARDEVPDLLTANVGRVAVRFSPHPAVLELCRATRSILVASSANISGGPPAASRSELPPALVQGSAGLYASGPEPAGTLPSTILGVTGRRGKEVLRVLRQGAISEQVLRDAGFCLEACS